MVDQTDVNWAAMRVGSSDSRSVVPTAAAMAGHLAVSMAVARVVKSVVAMAETSGCLLAVCWVAHWAVELDLPKAEKKAVKRVVYSADQLERDSVALRAVEMVASTVVPWDGCWAGLWGDPMVGGWAERSAARKVVSLDDQWVGD